MRFVCPCCGHRTLPEPPGTLAALCEVCAWEGRDPGGWLRFSGPALVEAQRRYLRTGACDPALAEFTRAPRADEARPGWWLPLDDTPAALIAAIEEAFADVGLAGGVTMAEANLIDDYGLPARDERARPPRGHGAAPRWQALTAEELEPYGWGPFSFIDARGIRYYAPALLRLDLRGEPAPAIESLVFTLTDGHQLAAVRALLDGAQRRTIARWFLYRAMVPGTIGGPSARAALRHAWSADLEPDERALLPGGV